MKKLLYLFFASLMILSLAACVGDKENTLGENNGDISGDVNKDNDNNIFDNRKITVEMVRNAPETSSTDFMTEIVDGGILLDSYTGSSEIVVIPEKIDGMPVVAIGAACFVNNEELKGIRISDSVIDIYARAFTNCYNVEIFISGKNVESIGEHAFLCCESLEFIELNNGIKSLGLSCFMGTESLEEIYIPLSVTELNNPFLETEDNATIICEAGSAAEAYAKDHDFKYEIK